MQDAVRDELGSRLGRKVALFEKYAENEEGRYGLVNKTINAWDWHTGTSGGRLAGFGNSDTTTQAARDQLAKAAKACETLRTKDGSNREFIDEWQKQAIVVGQALHLTGYHLDMTAQAAQGRVDRLSHGSEMAMFLAGYGVTAVLAPATEGGSVPVGALVVPPLAAAVGRIGPQILEWQTSKAGGEEYGWDKAAKQGLFALAINSPIMPGGMLAERLAGKGLENVALHQVENAAVHGLENAVVHGLENAAVTGLENGAMRGLENVVVSGLENITVRELENAGAQGLENVTATGLENALANGAEKAVSQPLATRLAQGAANGVVSAIENAPKNAAVAFTDGLVAGFGEEMSESGDFAKAAEAAANRSVMGLATGPLIIPAAQGAGKLIGKAVPRTRTTADNSRLLALAEDAARRAQPDIVIKAPAPYDTSRISTDVTSGGTAEASIRYLASEPAARDLQAIPPGHLREAPTQHSAPAPGSGSGPRRLHNLDYNDQFTEMGGHVDQHAPGGSTKASHTAKSSDGTSTVGTEEARANLHREILRNGILDRNPAEHTEKMSILAEPGLSQLDLADRLQLYRSTTAAQLRDLADADSHTLRNFIHPSHAPQGGSDTHASAIPAPHHAAGQERVGPRINYMRPTPGDEGGAEFWGLGRHQAGRPEPGADPPRPDAGQPSGPRGRGGGRQRGSQEPLAERTADSAPEVHAREGTGHQPEIPDSEVFRAHNSNQQAALDGLGARARESYAELRRASPELDWTNDDIVSRAALLSHNDFTNQMFLDSRQFLMQVDTDILRGLQSAQQNLATPAGRNPNPIRSFLIQNQHPDYGHPSHGDGPQYVYDPVRARSTGIIATSNLNRLDDLDKSALGMLDPSIVLHVSNELRGIPNPQQTLGQRVSAIETQLQRPARDVADRARAIALTDPRISKPPDDWGKNIGDDAQRLVAWRQRLNETFSPEQLGRLANMDNINMVSRCLTSVFANPLHLSGQDSISTYILINGSGLGRLSGETQKAILNRFGNENLPALAKIADHNPEAIPQFLAVENEAARSFGTNRLAQEPKAQNAEALKTLLLQLGDKIDNHDFHSLLGLGANATPGDVGQIVALHALNPAVLQGSHNVDNTICVTTAHADTALAKANLSPEDKVRLILNCKRGEEIDVYDPNQIAKILKR